MKLRRWIEYPLYLIFKQMLMRVDWPPIAAYPIMVFISLSLDDIFWEKGLSAAKQSIDDFLDDHAKRIRDYVRRVEIVRNPPALPDGTFWTASADIILNEDMLKVGDEVLISSEFNDDRCVYIGSNLFKLPNGTLVGNPSVVIAELGSVVFDRILSSAGDKS